MALLWADNFQQYGSSTSFIDDGLYTQLDGSIAVSTDPDPTAGGTKVINFTCSDARLSHEYLGSSFRKVLTGGAVTTAGVMCRVWLNTLPNSTSVWPQPMVFVDANNINQCTVIVSPTGTLKVFRGNALTGTLIAESSIAIVTNAWQHIECKLTISDTVGSVEIRVDTNTVLSATGLDTKNTSLSSISSIAHGIGDGNGTHGGDHMYIKDVVYWDTSGSLNNDFMGSVFVYSMRPDSDVSGTWTITGGAGSAWASINETSPDDDTKYISSPFPAATAQICTLTDLPIDATTVKGMIAFVRSKKSDGGDGNLQVSMVSGASTGNGVDRPLTVAYTYWTDVFETDPATGAAWTVAAANAAKIKFNRTL